MLEKENENGKICLLKSTFRGNIDLPVPFQIDPLECFEENFLLLHLCTYKRIE